MEDPPGSPKIKTEPHDELDVAPPAPQAPPFKTGEIIDLVSDDDDPETAASINVPSLGSPFHEEPQNSDAINLGPSMLSTKPMPTKPNPSKPSAKDTFARVKEKIAAK